MSDSGFPPSASGSWQRQETPLCTAADDAYLGAANLSARLGNGGQLPPVETAIVLEPGENVVYCDSFSEYAYATAQVTYTRGFLAAFGSPAWLAASLGGSALYNSYQRNKAEARGGSPVAASRSGSSPCHESAAVLAGQARVDGYPLRGHPRS